MGYDPARFVSEIDEEFHCSICTMVLENPMQSPCEHIFCCECIKGWLKVEKSCPTDRFALEPDELRSTPRYFRSILDKMELRCDFAPKGCETIVPLEQLQDHLAKCLFNPDAVVICDKGCNIKMIRREYELNNCYIHMINWHQLQFDKAASHQQEEFTKQRAEIKILNNEAKHSANIIQRQGEEITKLSDEVRQQREEITKFIDEAVGHRKVTDELENELTKCKTVIQTQQKEIMKLIEELNGERKEITQAKNKISDQRAELTKCIHKSRILWNASPKWPICQYIKTSISQPQILEYDGSGKVAMAQIFFSLEPANPVFKIKVLNVAQNNFIGVGLTRKGHPIHMLPGNNDQSIGYCSKGESLINNKIEKWGPQWKNGDIIECGIRYPDDLTNDGKNKVAVYFSINERFAFGNTMELPLDGLLPTVSMWSQGNSRIYGAVSKAEFLDLMFNSNNKDAIAYNANNIILL